MNNKLLADALAEAMKEALEMSGVPISTRLLLMRALSVYKKHRTETGIENVDLFMSGTGMICPFDQGAKSDFWKRLGKLKQRKPIFKNGDLAGQEYVYVDDYGNWKTERVNNDDKRTD